MIGVGITAFIIGGIFGCLMGIILCSLCVAKTKEENRTKNDHMHEKGENMVIDTSESR